MAVKFVNINDKESAGTFYVRINNEEITLGSDTSEIITKLLHSFLSNYQEEQQILRGSSDFIYDSVGRLSIHFNNITFRRGRSYIKTPDWISRKKATIKPKKTKNNKCIQYAITVALNHKEIGKDPQSLSKIKPFISKYNRNDINFPAGIKEWKTFEQNNPNIALNILYVPTDTQEIKITYRSKYNRKCKNQVILLMITDNEQQDNIEKYHISL